MHEGEVKMNGPAREIFGEIEALSRLTIRVSTGYGGSRSAGKTTRLRARP
jgi:hypothetical protein